MQLTGKAAQVQAKVADLHSGGQSGWAEQALQLTGVPVSPAHGSTCMPIIPTRIPGIQYSRIASHIQICRHVHVLLFWPRLRSSQNNSLSQLGMQTL